MGNPLQANNSTITSAFYSLLWHQLVIVVIGVLVVAVAWKVIRTRAGSAGADRSITRVYSYDEPAARRFLRIGFGCLWLFDGILQTQKAMAFELSTGVLQPASRGSPGWVGHLSNIGVTVSANHPVTAAASIVWIEVGIGLLLLMAPRGRWSQLGGLVSLGWAVMVWVFGEAFGGLLAPGVSFMLGAPGSGLIYAAAGLLLTLPERSWASPRLGQRVLAVTGAFFVTMAVLQAWPGRGYWQGQLRGSTRQGTLTQMVLEMSHSSQPRALSSLISSFGSFDAAHGWGVNLFVVIALTTIGVGFLTRRPEVVRWAVVAGVVLCLADWVLVEDLGFLGGLGTDPNSMIPLGLMFLTGYLGLVRLPVSVATETGHGEAMGLGTRLQRVSPAYAFRAGVAVIAVITVLIGAGPMAAASTNPNADPILAEAADGVPSLTDTPAPPFDLTDQHGMTVSLADLRGRTVVLTFLDPVCSANCPVITQEFRSADRMLGDAAQHVEFVGVIANPLYRSTGLIDAYDRREGLDHLQNWLYLTGSPSQLKAIWASYGVNVQIPQGGAMVAFSDPVYLVDGRAHTRAILTADQGMTPQAESSFSGLLTQEIDRISGS